MSDEIQVLVVDDSAVMRKAITQILQTDRRIKVVGYGRTGKDAVEKVASLKPDIVTLDIEMPVMDGLTALKEIMKNNPLPVIMVSSLTTDGASATIDALEAGAVDFIPKNFTAFMQRNNALIRNFTDKIHLLSKNRHKIYQPAKSKPFDGFHPAEAKRFVPRKRTTIKIPKFVIIGASTGGPKILQEIIPQLPAEFPAPILIVQHMPPHFTKSLADRLNNLGKIKVKEAADHEILQNGIVYIAPGGLQTVVERQQGHYTIRVAKPTKDYIHKPCIDLAALSIAREVKEDVLAVMLTGMGKDGLQGFQQIKASGNYIIAQSKETSIIYGMPKAVVDAGIADAVLDTDQITRLLLKIASPSPRAHSTMQQ